MRGVAILAAMLVWACAPDRGAQTPARSGVRLDPLWTVRGLANPESAALSADGTFLYVSNVAGEGDAADGQGFISRVSREGRMLEREWASGLNAPKGVARAGDRLYVADIDALAIIDVNAPRVIRRIPAPGAKFLNDVAVAPDGRVLVTDSETARIYALNGDRLEAWLEHALLRSVNGLMPETDRLYVTTMQGLLLAVDYATRAIETRAEGLGEADGVVRVGEDLLVSEWPGVLHLVHPDGRHEIVLETRADNIYLNDILLVGDTLYAPNWTPGTLTAYRVLRR
jgi:sugar lactone lactonase YvrE